MRSFAYAVAASTHSCAPPAASAAVRSQVRSRAVPADPRSTCSGSTRTPVNVTLPSRRVGSRQGGAPTSTPAASRSTTTMSSSARIRRCCASPAPGTSPASPDTTPSEVRVAEPASPTAAACDPSASAGRKRARCPSSPAVAISADAMTVGRNGPGAMLRPSSSSTTTSSGSPYPDPPCSSGRCSPSQPSSAISRQNGGRVSSGASSRARAAARALFPSRNARATSASSRCASVIAIAMDHPPVGTLPGTAPDCRSGTQPVAAPYNHAGRGHANRADGGRVQFPNYDPISRLSR